MRKQIPAFLLLAVLMSCKINAFQEWPKPTKYHVSGKIDTTWIRKLGPFKVHWVSVCDTNIYVQDTTLIKDMHYEGFLKRMVR